jgi:hypothetical protein
MEPKPAPKKAGRKPILETAAVAAALVTFNGNLKAVARSFGVHRSSVQEFVGKSASLTKILHDSREGELDDAESSLYRAILAGEAWAVCFKLKTQGKGRGYVERIEQTGADGGAIKTEQAGDAADAARLLARYLVGLGSAGGAAVPAPPPRPPGGQAHGGGKTPSGG